MIDYKNIFEKQYRKLCLYAVHYVSDVDTAEDMVMDVLTKVCEKEQQGETILNAEVYIFHAVRNNCLRYIQRNKVVRTVSNLPDAEYDTSDGQEELAREERLWSAVDNLPGQCRRIFMMSKRDGMKYQEISEELGLSVKTIEAQIGKAYKILRGKAMDIYFFFFFL